MPWASARPTAAALAAADRMQSLLQQMAVMEAAVAERRLAELAAELELLGGAHAEHVRDDTNDELIVRVLHANRPNPVW